MHPEPVHTGSPQTHGCDYESWPVGLGTHQTEQAQSISKWRKGGRSTQSLGAAGSCPEEGKCPGSGCYLGCTAQLVRVDTQL